MKKDNAVALAYVMDDFDIYTQSESSYTHVFIEPCQTKSILHKKLQHKTLSTLLMESVTGWFSLRVQLMRERYHTVEAYWDIAYYQSLANVINNNW